MSLIGNILAIIIGSYNLSKRYKEEGFRTVAYLFIIVLILSLFNIPSNIFTISLLNTLPKIFTIISSIIYFIGIKLIYTSVSNVLKRFQ